MTIKNIADTETVVEGNTTLALDLYQKLKAEKGNLFFSPYSISTALAMTHAGARGKTEKEMAQALHFTLNQERLHPAFASTERMLKAIQQKSGLQLNVANALWPHKDYLFLESFLTLMKEYYGVSITSVDYGEAEAVRKMINAWVEEKTNDKIKELLQKGVLMDLTRLVLVNAIYFKGDWANYFDKDLTSEAPFWLASGESIKTPMMTQAEPFRYGENDCLQILELPYVGDDLSMILLLPREIDGLAELEKSLTVENLENWTGRLSQTKVEVFLPKFKLSSQFSLKKALQTMGMLDAFDMDRADFSGMDGYKELYISAVIHKAFVEVNEEGTEAATSTGIVINLRSIPPTPSTFRADHPFIFLIRDNQTGSILFLGRVANLGKRNK